MLAIKQQMIQKLAVALIVIVLLCSSAYIALLTNWFRYRLSLEATLVAVPLAVGAFISVLLAVVAYIKGYSYSLIGAVVALLVAACIVMVVQQRTFGHMPAFFTNDVEKSPIGYLTTPQGSLEYWIELENPFASTHREYLLVRFGQEQYRIIVPIFDAPLSAFVSPVDVTDWGQLTVTSNPEIFVLTLGPSLLREGRFRINLAMRQAEKM